MNGYVHASSASSVACESFLESYSRGSIDVGGPTPPENASLDVPLEILLTGHFEPPTPPDEAQRVRELYTLLSLFMAYSADINIVY